VGNSATLDTTTSFEGNILALTSTTLDTGATDQCGRALAHTGAVTMDTNTLSIGCTNLLGGSTGTGGGGSGLGGGPPTPLPSVSTPEPGTMLLLGSGLASFLCMMRMKLNGREPQRFGLTVHSTNPTLPILVPRPDQLD
jgi:Ice-binding-like/PEP-CTERM motif